MWVGASVGALVGDWVLGAPVGAWVGASEGDAVVVGPFVDACDGDTVG